MLVVMGVRKGHDSTLFFALEKVVRRSRAGELVRINGHLVDFIGFLV